MSSSQVLRRLSVVHVEDDFLWRELACRVIRETLGVDFMGHAGDCCQALKLCRENNPSLVLVDLILPDGDGFHLAGQIGTLPAAPRVLLLSSRTDDVTLFRAWSGNVAGLIWKTTDCVDHLRDALVAVGSGRRYFPPGVMAAVNRFRASPDAFFKILSPREQVLMEALVQGDSDSDIARQTDLSIHTIHTHRKRIMAKLNLHSTRELMRWGTERGFFRGSVAPAHAIERQVRN